jgi:hypothetical protein
VTACPVLASYQRRLSSFGGEPELDHEVAGQILRLDRKKLLATVQVGTYATLFQEACQRAFNNTKR